MDLFRIFALSSAGMSAQKSRMNVVSGNLVNSQTTRTPEGGPYRRRTVVFRSVPMQDSFSTLLEGNFGGQLGQTFSVEVAGVRESPGGAKTVYDPGHPDANAEGFVSLPDINVMREMADLMSAVRSYEANLTAFNATRTLIRRVLDLGRVP